MPPVVRHNWIRAARGDHDQPARARVGRGTRARAGDRDRAWRCAGWSELPPADEAADLEDANAMHDSSGEPSYAAARQS